MIRNKGWWVFAAIIWMVVIFFFTHLPYFTGDNTSSVIHKVLIKEHNAFNIPSVKQAIMKEVNFVIRKATHLSAFGILAFLLFKVIENYQFSYFLSWLLTFLYAMTDEWHQSYKPRRTSSFKDVLNDALGALVVLTLTKVFSIINRKVRSWKWKRKQLADNKQLQ